VAHLTLIEAYTSAVIWFESYLYIASFTEDVSYSVLLLTFFKIR